MTANHEIVAYFGLWVIYNFLRQLCNIESEKSFRETLSNGVILFPVHESRPTLKLKMSSFELKIGWLKIHLKVLQLFGQSLSAENVNLNIVKQCFTKFSDGE